MSQFGNFTFLIILTFLIMPSVGHSFDSGETTSAISVDSLINRRAEGPDYFIIMERIGRDRN